MTDKTPTENKPLYVAGGNRVVCHRHKKGYTIIAMLENPKVGCFICEREEKAATCKTPIEKAAEDVIEFLATEYADEIRAWHTKDVTDTERQEILDGCVKVSLRRLEKEVGETLRFYADSRRYDYDETCCPEPYYPKHDARRTPVYLDEYILSDNGERARALLNALAIGLE